MTITERSLRLLTRALFNRQEATLARGPAPDMDKRIEKALLHAFHLACRRSPAYRNFLYGHGLRPSAVKTLAHFVNDVPIMDKSSFFDAFPPEQVFPGLRSRNRGRVWTSSGTTGSPAVGFASTASSPNSLAIDFVLHHFFRTLDKKTLFINCLPDAWPIPSKFVQSANVGTRVDLAVAIIRRLSRVYEQFIAGGEPLLLKRLVAEAETGGIDLSRLSLSLVAGGDYVPEALKHYLHERLNPALPSPGASPPNRVVRVMGLAEFGVAVFFETRLAAGMRRAASTDPRLAQALGSDSGMIPQLFQYNPLSTYVETVSNSEGQERLVLTNLNPDSELPLMRYDTKDLGRVHRFPELMARFCPERPKRSSEPRSLPFPFVAALGRRRGISTSERAWIGTAEAMELLFSDRHVASGITGNFQMHPPKGTADAEIQIQLAPGTRPSDLPGQSRQRLLESFGSRHLQARWVPYAAFRKDMGLLYDKKFTFT